MDVDFYFSVGSRYSYLASTRLAGIASARGCRFVWRPVHNPRLLRRRGRDPFEGERRSILHEEWFRREDVARWAELYGVPYVEPAGRLQLDSDRLALAATAGARLGAVEAMGRELFALVFTLGPLGPLGPPGPPGAREARLPGDGRELARIDDDALAAAAGRAGLRADAFRAALADPATADDVERGIDDALARGVAGVPTFFLGDASWFGNDRLPLLEHALSRSDAGDGAGI